MDTYADDLATLIESLDLEDAIHVGHSAGGGEVASYIGRYEKKRIAKIVLIAAVPPLMLKTEVHPSGLPMKVFDGICAGVLADRSQFFKDLAVTFYGSDRPGAKVSQGLLDSFWLQGMRSGLRGVIGMHSGILRDRLYSGLEEDRCTNADFAWRRRPDCANRRISHAFGEDDSRSNPEDLPRRIPWTVLNP